jgi:hypothetical protein
MAFAHSYALCLLSGRQIHRFKRLKIVFYLEKKINKNPYGQKYKIGPFRFPTAQHFRAP